MENKRGRPRKLTLVTFDEGVEKIREALLKRFESPMIALKKTPSKKTLQNMTTPSRKELRRYGDNNCPMLDLDELLKKFCG